MDMGCWGSRPPLRAAAGSEMPRAGFVLRLGYSIPARRRRCKPAQHRLRALTDKNDSKIFPEGFWRGGGERWDLLPRCLLVRSL